MIKPKDFLAAVDDARVTAAIRAAELRTSCEFRVFVSHRQVTDAVAAARSEFTRLKMFNTKQHNAVLIFVAPLSRKFALFADAAAHAQISQPELERLSAETGEHFKTAGYTDGLEHALASLAALLAPAFPPDATAGNELSDDVARD